MKRPQAEKANRAQVELHIQRQKELRELMIDDDDEPTWVELLATAIIVIVVGIAWWLS